MKKLKQAFIGIVLLLVGGGGYVVADNAIDNFGGGGWYASGEVLIGTATSFCRLPSEMVFADSTTTDPALDLGGCTLDQVVETQKMNTVILNLAAKGGTATSSIILRQMGSHDGTNFFDLATTTATFTYENPGAGLRAPTSTSLTSSKVGFNWAPGTATSTLSVPVITTGYKFTRFLIYGEDVTTDPDDGVTAWINAVKVDPITR